jgi:tRNA wybutosine-synthesizing protein 3
MNLPKKKQFSKKEKEFFEAKEKALHSLEIATLTHAVDLDILPLLTVINTSKRYYSSSSCAGRLVLLQIPIIGDKRQAEFIGKWHRPIDIDEFFVSLEKATSGFLWFLAQAPILHVGAKTTNDAEHLMKTAIRCGLKNSGLKSIGKKIIVEINSTERIDAPIGKDGTLYYDRGYIPILVDLANMVLERSQIKVQRLERELRKSLSTNKTTLNRKHNDFKT